MRDILIFLIAITGCYLFGEGILSRVLPKVPVKRRAGLAISLGMGIMAYLVYLVGSAGILSALPLVIVFFTLLLLAIILRKPKSADTITSHANHSGVDRVFCISIMLFSGISLFGALAPPTGTDSLSYHLAIPAKFLMQGKIAFVPYTMNSLYPFFMEMIFLAMEALRSGVAAKLFHWICGPLTVLSILFFMEEVSARKAGMLAGILFISSPGIFNGMTYAYVDVGLTLYITLSVVMFILWDVCADVGRKSSYMLFSGIFMGMALSIKYLALYMMIPVFLLLSWRVLQLKEKRIKSLLLFLVPCFVLSFFWYLKSFVVLGNPVFPAFSSIFPGVVSFDVSRHMSMGTGKGIVSFLTLPWNISVHPDIFGGRGSQIGVQFGLFLPFIVHAMFSKKKWIKDLSFLTAVYFLIWFFLVQRDRFLYPILPLLSMLAGYSIAYLFSTAGKGQRRVLVKAVSGVTVLIFSAALLFNSAICVYHNRHNYPVVLGMETREDYLTRWTTNYRMAQYVNSNLPEDSKILGIGIYKPYYFNRWLVRQNIFDLWENYVEKYEDPRQMMDFLKEKGFTHVVYNRKNDEDIPDHVGFIIDNAELIYSYGPVRNVETGWEEEFYLYKI